MFQNKTINPKAIALIGSLLLIVTLFLPFASATDNYEKQLTSFPDQMYIEELNMTNDDVINLSLFEFGKIYAYSLEVYAEKTISIICLAMIAAYVVFSILALLWSALSKPIPLLMTNLFAFGIFNLMKWDFKDRGVIANSLYHFGIAQYVCLLAFLMICLTSIYLFRHKKKQ